MEGFVSTDNEKGVVVQLSSEAVESLRQAQARHDHKRQLSLRDRQAEEDKPHDSNWDVHYKLPHDTLAQVDQHDESGAAIPQVNDKENNNSANVEDDADSLSPPPHMPLVLVNSERLVGYIPSNDQEREMIREQVELALHHNGERQDEALYFDERVSEMFDNGLARHCDTEQYNGRYRNDNDNNNGEPDNNNNSHVAVEYPEYIVDRVTTVLHPTARLWKRLLQPVSCNVVQRVLDHLRNCNRSLLWKHALYTEIVQHILPAQEQKRIQSMQEKELTAWKMGKRRERLDQLYQVRETLEHELVNVEQAKLVRLQNELEERVALALRNECRQGLAAFDLNSTQFHFPSNNIADTGDGVMDLALLGVHDYDDDDNVDDIGGSFVDDYDESNDAYNAFLEQYKSSDDESAVDNVDEALLDDADHVDVTSSDTVSLHKAGKKKADNAKKKYRQFLQQAKEADYQAKLKLAKDAEDDMRMRLTTTEHKVQIALVNSLSDRLQQVDDLLEELQEEEWKDEEENDDIDEHKTDIQGGGSSSGNGDMQFTLLDQILAMIFSATSCPSNSDMTEAQFYNWIRTEHEAIVSEWKTYFGQLPSLDYASEEEQDMINSSTPPPPLLQAESEGDAIQEDNVNALESEGEDNGDTYAVEDELSELNIDEKLRMKEELGIVDNDDEDWE